jgi:iron complex outermembrane receptor protein
LRSLGENRTLVLVNGRRFVSAGFGSADSSGDLNSIPGTAIERIEVLKDGASAIYGSDSMGGVVNIITRRRFAATEVEAFGGVSAHGDGQLLGISGTTGVSSDRGNALISASFYDQQSVGAGDRSFSSSGLLYDAVNGVTIPQQGSSNVPQGRFLVPAPGTPVPNPNNDSRIALYNHLVTTYPEATSFIHDPAAALGWRPFDAARDTYNFQPENYNQTPTRRIALFSTGDLNVGHRVRAYYEASYVNRQSEQQLAPDVYGTDFDFAVVSSANHYNPFGIDLEAVRTRLMNSGDRRFRQNVDSFRGVAGIDGTLPRESGPLEGWFWDVSLNYSHSAAVTATSGEHNPEHTPQAVGPSWVDEFGKAHCGTTGNMISGCVPLDLFHGTPSLSAEQTAYTLYSGTNRGIDELTQIQASLGGDLFRLASERRAGFAAGYEYRLVHGAFTPDQVRGPAANNGEFETAFLLTSGGNPQLKPETAKIYTVGIVLEPSFIRELSLTVDYYNISIADAISTAGPNVMIGQGGLCSTDDTVRRRVHAYNAWDLYASYSLRTGVGRTTLAAGVNNVFNTPPPTIYSSFWPTSDPMAYDFIGRFFYVRLAQRFE